MKVNNSGTLSRNSSIRSSRRSNTSTTSSISYSSPANTPSPLPKSPIMGYHQKSPVTPTFSYNSQVSPKYQKTPAQNERFNSTRTMKSPNCQITSNETNFDFSSIPKQVSQKSPCTTPKSPRSSRDNDEIQNFPPNFSEIDFKTDKFNLQSPPKYKSSSRKLFNRQHQQLSRTESNFSTKSSLEYKSTTKHPKLDYQDIEYKVCNSLDSDFRYRASDTSSNCVEVTPVRHASLKDKKRTRQSACNIHTNPGYDDRYSSSKSINESAGCTKPLQRCRKSTSDLTDLTDDGPATTMTSLSRPTSPRRKSSVKGGLAYLASRRGSRDSVTSNASNVSYEDIGPLNFQNTTRGRQRRTSNFLELPGESFSALSIS